MIQKTDTILITGCGGMLGEAVYNRFKDYCHVVATDIDLNSPWLEYLDVSSRRDVDLYVAKVRPDYIVHLAALTDMEYCELNPEHAYAVNSEGVQNLANYARIHDIPFVYISTAGIFDGDLEAYTEDDIPNPQSVYGKSKYSGELIAHSLSKSIIIRAGWMMGGGPDKDKKFVNKLIKQIRVGAKKIPVVDDKHGTPCYTYDLAGVIEYLLNNQMYGVFHGACRGGGSRYDVAELMIKILKRKDISLERVDSGYFNENYFAPRPTSEKLLDTRLISYGLTRDWKICLTEYLQKFDWRLDGLETSGMDRTLYRNYFEADKNHWLMRGRRQILSDLLEYYTGRSSIKVLDLACGVGHTVAELAAVGHDAHGVDISAEAVRLGEVYGVKNLKFLDSSRTLHPNDHFDAVLLVDLLEHLKDESWAMDEAYRILRPGGIAIIVTPAFKFLWGIHDEMSNHYRRYNMAELLAVVAQTPGFKVVKKSYFNTLLFVPIVAFRLLRKLFRINVQKSDFSIGDSFLNSLFGGIFAIERRIIPHAELPFGISTLLVLKKQ